MMFKFLKKFQGFSRKLIRVIIPYYVRSRANPESKSIIEFVEFASKNIKKNQLMLDAGAGSCAYKKYFSHAKYESTDFENVFDSSSKGIHDFVCDLADIPKKNDTYDAILCTQVLEHVENPQKVVSEFFRILKPGGKLFLSAPQAWEEHGQPYNFFNFTKYGLESIFKRANFRINFIKPMGGFFWFLGNRIRWMPHYIYNQQIIKRTITERGIVNYVKPSFWAVILFPFYLASLPFTSFIIPMICYYLDFFDKRRDWTLGYTSYCVKPK